MATGYSFVLVYFPLEVATVRLLAADAVVFDVDGLTVTVSVASVPRLLGQPAQFCFKKSLIILFLLSEAYSSVLRGFLGCVIVLNVTF